MASKVVSSLADDDTEAITPLSTANSHCSEVSKNTATEETTTITDNNNDNNPSSIEERYESEREKAKVRHWKESVYAVGLVEPTWADEFYRQRSKHSSVMMDDPTCGCVKIGAILCARLGARRIGNMAVLRESVVNSSEVNDEEYDEVVGGEEQQKQNGENSIGVDEENPRRKRNVSRREIDIVVGPFWPFLVFITYPLIFGVSFWAGSHLPGKPPLFIFLWSICTCAIIVALFQTGCRDPGIMIRRRESPTRPGENETWRWNDQALTWRPRGAMYDPDCACVVEKFDHTCPWTGTAIGKNNMAPFQSFVGLVFFNLMMDIYLIANA